jgi:hypothetical protein
LEKWKTRADEEDAARIEPVGDGAVAITIEGENTRGKQKKQPVNTLEKHKDSVSGVAGVPRASNSPIS